MIASASSFHRFAAREAELATVACEIRPGSLRDAILHSAGANATHGLRRSNADKRRAALMLIEDEEWGAWSDREIGRRCAVSHDFVSRLRSSLSSNDSEASCQPRTYEDRHGNVTQMRTAAIGRKPVDPQPEIPADKPAPAEPQAETTNVVPLAPHLPELPTP